MFTFSQINHKENRISTFVVRLRAAEWTDYLIFWENTMIDRLQNYFKNRTSGFSEAVGADKDLLLLFLISIHFWLL